MNSSLPNRVQRFAICMAVTITAVGVLPNFVWAQTGSTSPHGAPSITNELEKLFNESGQEMPSMRTKDLPYATTPQMDRVRRKNSLQTANSAAPVKKKRSLFDKMFGRFRRDRSRQEDRRPEPPPIIVRDQRPEPQMQQRPAITSNQVAGNRRSVKAPQQRRERDRPAVAQTPATAPAARQQSRQAQTQEAEIPRLELVEDDFVNPFEEADLMTAANELLDLDAVGAAPHIAASPAAQLQHVEVAQTEEPNPFTGVRIQEADEFSSPPIDEQPAEPAVIDNPFVVDQSNPFMEADNAAAETNAPPLQIAPARGRVAAVAVSGPSPFANSREAGRLISEERQLPESAASSSFGEFVDQATQSRDRKPQQPLTRAEQIEARRHLPGFMGFCPVELRDKQQLVDSDSQYKARFGLQSYNFSSAAALKAFRSNPTYYVPVAGGADVVALVNAGEEQAGSIRFAMWYRDRLFLFHSQETKDLFCEAPAEFADEY